jgi:hypothetical protein
MGAKQKEKIISCGSKYVKKLPFCYTLHQVKREKNFKDKKNLKNEL